jgi:hypothetical protein
MIIFGQCDCCAKYRVLHERWPWGTETWACSRCCFGDLADDIDDLEEAIGELQKIPDLKDDNTEYLKQLELALAEARNSTNERPASHGPADDHGAQPLQS